MTVRLIAVSMEAHVKMLASRWSHVTAQMTSVGTDVSMVSMRVGLGLPLSTGFKENPLHMEEGQCVMTNRHTPFQQFKMWNDKLTLQRGGCTTTY